jgi:hypothetical protein
MMQTTGTKSTLATTLEAITKPGFTPSKMAALKILEVTPIAVLKVQIRKDHAEMLSAVTTMKAKPTLIMLEEKPT